MSSTGKSNNDVSTLKPAGVAPNSPNGSQTGDFAPDAKSSEFSLQAVSQTGAGKDTLKHTLQTARDAERPGMRNYGDHGYETNIPLTLPASRDKLFEGRTTGAFSARFKIRPDGVYLITGGLGALGLHTAEWLAREGAKSIVLTGRGAPNEEAKKHIAEIQASGAEILVKQADIADEEDVQQLIAEIDRAEKPLRGVFHAAGVLADGVLQKLDWAAFEKVMAPKIRGAWLLHHATKDKKLDCFVLYSSIASMFGSTGQGNYAAANAFLDAFAHYRRSNGLPATSVNWGAWEAGGMIAGLGKRGEQLRETGGVGMIPPGQGTNLLQHILDKNIPQPAVLPMHWPTFLAQFPAGKTPSFYEEIRMEIDDESESRGRQVDLLTILQEAAPSEREEILTEHVREHVIHVLGLNADQPPALNQGLTDLGMDSLMAVELGNRLQASAGVKLPSTFAFEYPSIGHIAGFLAEELLDGFEETSQEAPVEEALQQQIESEVGQLQDEEIESSLLDELEKAGF